MAAAALKCLGGAIQGRLYPRNESERSSCSTTGSTSSASSRPTTSSPARTSFFAATGITDGSLLRGVKYWPDGATTYSMVMRSRSGTVRIVEAEHRFEKLERFSRIDYRR